MSRRLKYYREEPCLARFACSSLSGNTCGEYGLAVAVVDEDNKARCRGKNALVVTSVSFFLTMRSQIGFKNLPFGRHLRPGPGVPGGLGGGRPVAAARCDQVRRQVLPVVHQRRADTSASAATGTCHRRRRQRKPGREDLRFLITLMFYHDFYLPFPS